MNEIVEQPTAEQIQKHYDAAMDSVHLIQAGKPDDMTDEDWADTLKRNVEHLEIMVAKDFMQDQDLAPLQAAIAKGK